MLIKPCNESEELRIFHSLDKRMMLSDKEKQYYQNLVKGYEGERIFSERLADIQSEGTHINDLLLETNNTGFQIDSLLITKQVIYLFEVKNYEGDFYFEKDIWYAASGTEIKNPLLQLRRTESLFRRMLQEIRFSIPIEPYIIFINPEFTLYNAPQNQPIIYPTQLTSFLKKLQINVTKPSEKQEALAQKLLSLHKTENPYRRLPAYSWDTLQKGLLCLGCRSFLVALGGRKVVCDECGYEEEIDYAVIRHVDEVRLLFPDKPLTTAALHEWCQVVTSRKTIRRILSQHFSLKYQGRHSYFI